MLVREGHAYMGEWEIDGEGTDEHDSVDESRMGASAGTRSEQR